MSELVLRRKWAENPAHFDAVRRAWQRDMRRLAIKRDRYGRFTNQEKYA